MCLFFRKLPTSPSSRVTPVRLWRRTDEADAPLTLNTSPPLLLLVGLWRTEVGLCVTDGQVIKVNRLWQWWEDKLQHYVWVSLHDAAAHSLVFTRLVMVVLQMGSCMLVQSVISKEMNPLFTRLSARGLLWKQKTRSTGFKVQEKQQFTLCIIM